MRLTSNHTKGPWVLDCGDHVETHLPSVVKRMLLGCCVRDRGKLSFLTKDLADKANVILILAAPELYDMLSDLCCLWEVGMELFAQRIREAEELLDRIDCDGRKETL